MLGAGEPLGGDGHGGEAELARGGQARSVGLVGDDHDDFRVQLTGGTVTGDGFEVRAAAREENGEALLPHAV